MARPEHEHTGSAWWERVPPVLWPVPVADAPSILGSDFTPIGSRVIVGHPSPESGRWIYEQRAATKIHEHQGEKVVGVLAEADWYRQQRDPTYVAVPHPVPAERVFCELGVPMHDETAIDPDQSDLTPDVRSASLVTDLTSPPVRWPRRASEERAITGARCWVLHHNGIERGVRAVGEPRRGEVGTVDFSQGLEGLDQPVISTVVPLYREDAWYRWIDTGDPGDDPLFRVETKLVFLE